MRKSPLLSLAVALVAACAVTGCGGGSSNSSEKLNYSEAETSIKKWAEENKPAEYSFVTMGRCNQDSAKAVSCIYVYHKEAGDFDQYEDREAEATLTSNGYTSVTDKGRVSE